jgi:ATP phosphoribosyltransferase
MFSLISKPMRKLKIAVQKSGRLHDDSMKILKEIGISIDNGKDQLKASARNFPLEVFYLRNGDIPQYLKDGVVDAAIIGENVLIEKGNDLKIVERLGFSKCKVPLRYQNHQKRKTLRTWQVSVLPPLTLTRLISFCSAKVSRPIYILLMGQ